MDYQSFKKLAGKLRSGILRAMHLERSFNTTGRHSYNYQNGRISTSVRLACAIRYFAGASPYDLMTTYQIGQTDVMRSVWYVVDAVNSNLDFNISYPTDHNEQ